MSLTSALRSATSSLKALQTQTAIVSTNIANAGTAGATRKYANLVTDGFGGVVVGSVTQAQNASLFAKLSQATAGLSGTSVIADGLEQLKATIGDTNSTTSPAAKIASLTAALKDLSNTPGSYDLARVVAAAASDLAASVKSASDTVLTVRQNADKELAASAEQMNKLLGQIESLNKKIVAGSATGEDVTALVDQRSNAILELSEYTGVIVSERANNDVALYTDSGVTLFDVSARKVEFAVTSSLDASVSTGAVFRIDGVVVAGENALMPVQSGRIAGLVALRDEVAPAYQSQLDEIARSLVAAFSETANGRADMAGAFGSKSYPTGIVASLGTANPSALAAGDEIAFTFTYNDETYTARYRVVTAPVTADAFEAGLQSAVDTAVSSSGKAFGAGRVSVDIASGGAITMTPQGAGVYMNFGVTSVSARADDAAKKGGLAAVGPAAGTTATAAMMPAVVTGSGTGGATDGTAASVSGGDFDVSNIAVGDTLAFDLTYNGTVYKVSKTFATAPADAAAYASALADAIAAAKPENGGPALGRDKITVSAGAGGEITVATVAKGSGSTLKLSAGRVDSPVTVTAVSAYDPATGTIAAGDRLSFDLTVNGTTYHVSHTFAAEPADAAAYASILQSAIDGAVAVPGGQTLGFGKVTVKAAAAGGPITLTTVAGGTSAGLALANVTASDGANSLAKAAGLGTGAVPDAIKGLAGTLTFSAAVSLDPKLLRDGGINGGDYIANKEGAESFNARIADLQGALSRERTFSATGTAATGSILSFATSSFAWVDEMRSTTNGTVQYQAALLSATQQTYSSSTGVNMDEELTRLIEIERSYQASSKILSTVDEMFASLFQSVS